MLKRRILSGLIALSILFILFSLTACGGYKEVPQTEEEARVVMTLGEYRVTADLYLALYRSHSRSYDRPEEHRAEIDAAVLSRLGALFAPLLLYSEGGGDPSGDEIGDRVDDAIAKEVEAYGSHEAYLAALREGGLNDYVARLLYRSGYCEEALLSDATTVERQAALSYETVSEFFASNRCSRVVFFRYPTKAKADAAYADAVQAAQSGGDAKRVLASKTMMSVAEIEEGEYIGDKELDRALYGDAIDAAFSLAVGEFSGVLDFDGSYCIVYRMEKDGDALSSADFLSQMRLTLCRNLFYDLLDERASALAAQVQYTDLFDTISTEG